MQWAKKQKNKSNFTNKKNYFSPAEGEKMIRYIEKITNERPESFAGFPGCLTLARVWLSRPPWVVLMPCSTSLPPHLLFPYSSSTRIVTAAKMSLQKPWTLTITHVGD